MVASVIRSERYKLMPTLAHLGQLETGQSSHTNLFAFNQVLVVVLTFTMIVDAVCMREICDCAKTRVSYCTA